MTSCSALTVSTDSVRDALAGLAPPASKAPKPKAPKPPKAPKAPKGRRLLQATPARKVLLTFVAVGEDFGAAIKQCKNLAVTIPASTSKAPTLTCTNCPVMRCFLALKFKCGSGVQLKARAYNSPADPAVFVDTPVPMGCDAARAAPCKNWA